MPVETVLTGGTNYGAYVCQSGFGIGTLGPDVQFSSPVEVEPPPPPPPSPNFDDDGDIDVLDINLLIDGMGGNPAIYDLNVDGVVDQADLTYLVETFVEWSVSGGASGVGTFLGDFNLDGAVNGTDLSIMSNHFGESSGWGIGNAYGDGRAGAGRRSVAEAKALAGGQ